MNTSNFWTVEYSIEQGAFHVDTLDRVIELNQEHLSRGMVPQYSVIAVFGSHAECIQFTDDCRKLMRSKLLRSHRVST